MIIRLPIEQIALSKRATQGVRLIKLNEGHIVSTIAIVPKTEECEECEDVDVLEAEISDVAEHMEEEPEVESEEDAG